MMQHSQGRANESTLALIKLQQDKLLSNLTVVFFTNNLGLHSKGTAKYCRDTWNAENGECYYDVRGTVSLYAIPAFTQNWELMNTDEIIVELDILFKIIETDANRTFFICRIEDTNPRITLNNSTIQELFEDYYTLKNVQFTDSYRQIILSQIMPPSLD